MLFKKLKNLSIAKIKFYVFKEGNFLKKKLIIFDADGTLWDSRQDVIAAVNYVLKENANLEITKEEFQKFDGFSLEYMFKAVLPLDKKHLSENFIKLFIQYYINNEHFLDNTLLFPEVKNTLEKLKKQGFLMAICSRKTNRAVKKMLNHFSLSYFDLVVGTEESKFKHKPNPEAINYIMDYLNITSKDAVIVGDSRTDVLTGKNAAIETIAVTYGGYDTRENLLSLNPTYLIDNFGELRELLQLSKTS